MVLYTRSCVGALAYNTVPGSMTVFSYSRGVVSIHYDRFQIGKPPRVPRQDTRASPLGAFLGGRDLASLRVDVPRGVRAAAADCPAPLESVV